MFDFRVSGLWGVLVSVLLTECDAGAQSVSPVPIEITALSPIHGLEDWDWTQARTAFVDREHGRWVTTMSQTKKLGSHGYFDIYESVSLDAGKTWSEPQVIDSLKRGWTDDGYAVAPGDLWPSWHPQSGALLVTGKTFNFADGSKENYLRERVSYAVKGSAANEWGAMKFLQLPVRDHSGAPLLAANAGCNQPFLLASGDVLLPIRYQRSADERIYTSAVARCRFDGETLHYLRHGSEHTIDAGRGLYEPSVVGFNGQYFLTLRSDDSAYVTKGDDGLQFGRVREWRFDDGSLLGSYNTQQHWLSVGGGLFLIYTRRGAANDHIFRHRAPLFIGQVDPDRLVVLRETERILLREEDACLGNSGVCRISDSES